MDTYSMHIGCNLLKGLRKFNALFFSAAFGFLLASSVVWANPEAGQVVAGQAAISSAPDPAILEVNQSTEKAVINWHSFNVSPTETVRFNQPGSSSITLNRVDPAQGASAILGRLSANGQIWLINPAGIFFGSSARVDAAGIVAATAGISVTDFMSGNYRFAQEPNWYGGIVNQGNISVSDEGLVALVAPGVENSGVIQAQYGTIILASRMSYALDFYGDELINFGVNSEVTAPAVNPQTKQQMMDAVKNSGQVIANGGKILMTAKTAGNILDHMINMNGYAEATTAVKQGGSIVLQGEGDGVVSVTGKMNASGKSSQQKGGSVKVLSKKIVVDENAEIDASGDAGGGEILIGGNAHGAGSEMNAQYSYIGPDVIANASALTTGDGGKIVVWSDSGTLFSGKLVSRGGSESGNGGWLEVSGKDNLLFIGLVDTTAVNGLQGTLLLDPRNLTVATTSGSAYNNGVNNLFNNNIGSTNIITPASINAASADIILQANSDVTFTNALSMTTAGKTLTVQAGRSILVNANVSTNNGTISFAANDSLANNADRATGAAAITMGAGTSLNSGTADINLTMGTSTSAPFNPGAISLRDLIGNNVTINGQSNTGTTVTFNGNVTATNALTVTGGSTISQAVGTVLSGATLTAKTLRAAGAAITLGNTGNNFTTVDLRARNVADTANVAGALTYRDTNGFDVSAANTTSTVTLTGGDAITQSGPMTGSTLTVKTLNDSGSPITLNNTGNEFTTINLQARNVSDTANAAGAIGYTDATGVAISGINTASNLNLTAGGSLTQTGTLNVTGTPTFTFTAPTSDLSLASQDNNFSTTPVITDNANIRDILLRNINTSASVPTLPTLSALRDVTLNFPNVSSIRLPTINISRSLSVTANGPITQSGILTIPTTTTLAAGALNNITLSNSANNFGTVVITSGNNVSLQDTNALVLGASTISGTLDVTTNGALTQSGALAVTGLTTVSAGITNNITLNTATNNFSSIKVLSENVVNLRDADALVLNDITANGALTITTNGALTQTGIISATGGTTTLVAGAANDITLANSNNNFSTVAVTSGNNVSLADTNGVILGTSGSVGTPLGSLSVTAGGSITESGVLRVTGTPTFTVSAAGSDISLASQANDFATTPVFATSGLGSITNLLLRNTNTSAVVPTLPTGLNNLTLTFNSAPSLQIPGVSLTGSLSVTSSGPITQTGVLTVNGVGQTATFAAGSANNITLNNLYNDFSTLAITSGNDVSVVDANALILGTNTVSGAFNVSTSGAITQNGIQTITGLTTLDSHLNDITLSTTNNNFSTIKINNGSNVNIRDVNSLILDDISANGTLTVRTNGALTQVVGKSISATQGTTTLIAGALNDITLNNSTNDFSTVAVTSGNNVSLRDASGLQLGTSTISGNFDVTAGGALSQSGVLTVTGTPTFTFTTANSDVSLASQANVFSTTPVFTNNGNIRDLLLRNVDVNALVPTLPTGLRDLTLIFNGTNVSMNLPAVSISGNLIATATGAITQSGTLVGQTLTAKTLLTGGAAITLNNANNNFATVDLRARNAGDSANAAGALTYTDVSGFDISAANTASTINLIAGNAITQSGAMAGTTLTATILNNLGENITLNNAANALTGISLSTRNAANSANVAGIINYRDTNAIDIAQIRTTGSVTVTAGNVVTQSGAITAQALNVKTLNNTGASTNITLTDAGNNISTIDLRSRNAADSANVGGAISYTGAGGFDIQNISTTSVINLNAGGAITDSGSMSGSTLTLTSAGGSVLDFGDSLTGFNATNTLSGNISLINTGALGITGISQSGNGNISIVNTGAVTLSGSLIANGGSGAVSVDASGSLTLNNSVDAGSGLVSLNANTSGGAGVFSMGAGGSIQTTNASSNAVKVFVNAASGGTGTAALRDIAVGNGGTITVKTNRGSNVTGSDIVYAGGVLNAGSLGTVTLQTPNVSAINIGTSAAPIQINAGTLNASSGSSGIFITNAGSSSLTINTLEAFRSDTSALGTGQIISSGAVAQADDSNPINLSTLTVKTLNDLGKNILFTHVSNVAQNINLQTRNAADTADAPGIVAYAGSGNTNVSGLRTTNDALINIHGALTDSASMVVGGKWISTSVGGTTLNNANQINEADVTNAGSGVITISGNTVPLTISRLSQSGGGAVTLSNASDLNIADGSVFVTRGAPLSITVSSGLFSVGNSVTINSGNADVTISANDLNLNTTGRINAGSASLSITNNVANTIIGLGDSAGSMTISGSELERMFATDLSIIASSNGQILVDGISSANSGNISGLTRLTATTGTTGSITFQNNASTFGSLNANADGITSINTALNTSVGALTLRGGSQLNLNGNISSAGLLSVNGGTSGVILGASSNLIGNGITFNSILNGPYNLTLNAGSLGDVIFTADVGSASPLGMLTIVGYNTTGALAVGALSLNTSFANLTGSVAGQSGQSAIAGITLLNTIGPGTHFFDGIDMYSLAPPPSLDPVIPTTNISNVIFPTAGTLYGSENQLNQSLSLGNSTESTLVGSSNENGSTSHCVSLENEVQLCLP